MQSVQSYFSLNRLFCGVSVAVVLKFPVNSNDHDEAVNDNEKKKVLVYEIIFSLMQLVSYVKYASTVNEFKLE